MLQDYPTTETHSVELIVMLLHDYVDAYVTKFTLLNTCIAIYSYITILWLNFLVKSETNAAIKSNNQSSFIFIAAHLILASHPMP